MSFTEDGKAESIGAFSRHRILWAAIRPEQWLKNLFVLVPAVFGQKLLDGGAMAAAALAAMSFCLISSAIYLFNDIMDASADREHPSKRLRPVAAGLLSSRDAATAAIALWAGGFALGWRLGPSYLAIAMLYTVLALAYSIRLKQVVVLDVMIVAAGFVLRVIAGAAAVAVEPSHWLILCGFLLALHLAFVKRRREILTPVAGGNAAAVKGYTLPVLDQINPTLLGATIVCYACYAVAPETVARFGTHALIYGTGFVIYGLFRYLVLTHRGGPVQEPARLLLRDRPLLAAVIGWGCFNALVIYRSAVFALWDRLE